MKQESIITGEEIKINIRNGATFYETMQEIIRESVKIWKPPKNKVQRLKETRIIEKYAKKYGLQREFRENGII